jgi:hypothetical protein
LTSIAIERGQRCPEIPVAVGDTKLLAQDLEPSQGLFAQLTLEIRIAFTEKDPARGEPMLVDRAGGASLVRTAAAGHRLELPRAEFRGQVRDFGRRNEEAMIVREKVTAPAARLASAGAGGGLLRLRLDPVVKRRYFFEESAVSLGLSHHDRFSRILSMSSHV